MASQAVTSGAARNNGATVVYGGNVDNSNTVTNAPGIDHVGFRSGISGNAPVLSSTLGTHKPFSAGTFAYQMEEGKFVGKRLGEELSGVANDVLLSGGGYKGTRSAIHWLTTTRALGVNSWDYVTGAITKGGTAGDEISFGNDVAATPSRAVPGRLVITDHSKAKSGALAVPLSTSYSAKTG